MRLNRLLYLLSICLILFSVSAFADEVEYVVSGVDEPMLTNVQNRVTAFRIGSGAKLNARLRRKLTEDAIQAATDAMRPYGYFNPGVEIEINPVEADKWQVSVKLEAGPPVLVESLLLELTGPGKELKSLREWYAAFPLAQGKRLKQHAWDHTKLHAMELLEESGYLRAEFSRHVIRVNTITNTARLELVVDTGPRAVMGTVTFNQDLVSDQVLASLRRFKQGDAYHALLLEKFRLDMWRSGYFEDIEVVERRDLTANPPRVDLEVNFKPRKKNTYQGTLGFGTDTLARLQLFWGRHLLSPRGDNFDIGLGWQQKDNQLSLLANYRLPRKTENRQFWIATAGLQSESQALKVALNGDLENRLDIAKGTIKDYWLRAGRTRALGARGGFEQLFETTFIQYLDEKNDFQPTDNVTPMAGETPASEDFNDLLKNTGRSLVIGMDWDWPDIRGNGFQTTGHHQRAWVFTSNEAWGSDSDFSQVYLSSRWNFLATDRLKILLRAEAGYSNASSVKVTIPIQERELDVAVTELPHLYRFKAGGSRSVRGYGFNNLDNNGLGSNNIITASAEAEFLVRKNWSVAAFIDVGNAFNDWSHPDLKLGTGFGLRWYSLIGAIRLDVAQGRDLEGNPWRIHLTIGTTLL